ncbi:hypothetical protein BU16DRAFT_536726 [Lophium mytilinum]|uniref:C2H2-type domain-containing protein n=1 Tax=Lophium mytilinum TaxID=390894 RepID=A0A6A6R360_9PEZI|nr:hypothetical protein BU16DRAFT_536726 [Lophium mytilinum]
MAHESPSSSVAVFTDSDTDSEQSAPMSPYSSPESIPSIGRSISQQTRRLVDRVMNSLHFVFDIEHGVITCTGGADSSGSNPTRNTAPEGSWMSDGRSGPGRNKRNIRHDGSESPDDDDDHDEGHKRPRPNPSPTASGDTADRKLACPFFKRNPSEHCQCRSCTGPGFPTVARMKMHLYRNHMIHQCPRCSRNFKTKNDLKKHQRELQGCQLGQLQSIQVPEAIGPEQYDQLKSKKGLAGRSEVSRWEEVYRILFPNDDHSVMPSPFYENDTAVEPRDTTTSLSPAARFQEYSRRQLPMLVRRQLEELFEQKLPDQIEQAIRAGYEQLVSAWRNEVNSEADVANTAPAARSPSAEHASPHPTNHHENHVLNSDIVPPQVLVNLATLSHSTWADFPNDLYATGESDLSNFVLHDPSMGTSDILESLASSQPEPRLSDSFSDLEAWVGHESSRPHDVRPLIAFDENEPDEAFWNGLLDDFPDGGPPWQDYASSQIQPGLKIILQGELNQGHQAGWAP